MVPQCVSCIATGKLFVCIGKKKLFFVFFFETADRYTTGPLLDSEKYFRKKCIFSKSWGLPWPNFSFGLPSLTRTRDIATWSKENCHNAVRE